MTVRLKADGASGVVAVYDYAAGDDAPFTSPLSNVGRLFFHSGLPAVKIVSVQTGTTTLSALNAAANTAGGNVYSSLSEEKVLFAHGQGGIPYVEGRITSLAGSGVNIPLAGSVPIQRSFSHPRWLHLGADGTNVVLNTFITGYYQTNYASITVGYEVYVTDQLL